MRCALQLGVRKIRIWIKKKCIVFFFYHKIVVLSTSLHVWGIVGLCKSKTIQPDVNYNQTTAKTALRKYFSTFCRSRTNDGGVNFKKSLRELYQAVLSTSVGHIIFSLNILNMCMLNSLKKNIDPLYVIDTYMSIAFYQISRNNLSKTLSHLYIYNVISM